ncbi:lysylphosphatidylglycerol synthase transmembrane domain-containing protein [Acrocarpospora catenulata]|uniref:lysylphosphatidylglycerol synthase transmembrane domain-containing protein n=1 Tax=Acrocarpospora catenulata TaxID=2836182 RepID=UPI001BDADD26|nr:YbhN family protein [Acrocarpospora catenulata]
MTRGWKWVAVPTATGLAYLVLRDQLPSPAEIWAVVAEADLVWLGVAAGAQCMSMATFARLFRRLLALGGIRVSLGRAMAITYARNAVANSLPAGPVVSIAYSTREFGRLGAGRSLIAATLVLAAFSSGAAFGVLAAVALLGAPETRVPTLLAAAGVVVAAAVLVRVRRRVRLPRERAPRLVAEVRAARDAIRASRRDQAVLAALALANWLLDVACLAAVCLAVGAPIGAHTLLLGYVAAKAAAALAVVPGGLGVMEIGMAATFIAAGASGGAAAAVVALYRLISYWAVLVAGWLAWLFLKDQTRAVMRATGRALVRAGAGMNPFALPPAHHP